MSDKLLVAVRLPATMEDYEFLIPYDLRVEDAARLTSRMLAAREIARYEASLDVDFMYLTGKDAGTVVNPKETFRNLVLKGDLVNGSGLMLV